MTKQELLNFSLRMKKKTRGIPPPPKEFGPRVVSLTFSITLFFWDYPPFEGRMVTVVI